MERGYIMKWKQRPEQIDIVKKVADAFANNKDLIIIDSPAG